MASSVRYSDPLDLVIPLRMVFGVAGASSG